MTRLEIIRLKLNAANELVRELVKEHTDLMMRELMEVPKDCPIQVLKAEVDAMMVVNKPQPIKAEAWDSFKKYMIFPADVREEPVLKSAANQQEFNEKYLFRTKEKNLPIDMPPYSSNVPVNFYANAMKQAHADSLNIHTRIANLETRVAALEGGKKSCK